MANSLPSHRFSPQVPPPLLLRKLEHDSGYDHLHLHRHTYWEVFFFEKGGGEHIIDFESKPILDREVHFVSPGQAHLLKRSTATKGWVILFELDFFESLAAKQEAQMRFFEETPYNRVNLEKEWFEDISFLLKGIQKEVSYKEGTWQEIVRSYFNALLLICSRGLNISGFSPNKPDLERYLNFKRLVATQYLSWHKLGPYLQHLEISSHELTELSHKFSGKPPSELIYERLILEARRLLRFSQLSIKEIAYQLHFSDPSHFSSFFKRKTGSSPQAFRKDS